MAFKLNIITPENKVFEGEVDSAKCPGINGLFGILTNHAPMVSALGEGELVYVSSGQETSVKISGGFLEVANNVCSVLADSVD